MQEQSSRQPAGAALISETTAESSRTVLTDLTPATPAEGALERSASGCAAVLDPSPAGSGGPYLEKNQDTPRPGKAAKRKRSGRK